MLTQKLRILRERRRLEASCRWRPERLAAHQQASLASLRAFAGARSPFYARFHRGLEQRPLADLPILTKATLMEHFDDLVTDRSIRLADVEAFLRAGRPEALFRDRYMTLATSGSTGLRGVFLFDEGEWISCLANISRPMSWANVRPRLVHRLRSAMVASTSPWHYSAQVGRAFATRLLPTLRFDAADPVERIVEQMNAWQPDVLVAYPSVLRMLAAEQQSGRLRIAPTSCATSAEVLTEETRRRVREAFGIRVWETYGATEYAPIAAECAEGRMHLFEDGAIIEVVDERGQPVGPGAQGERVLVTVFGRYTQPLIRYEISDMVRVSNERCPCGRPHRTIGPIDGRQEDVLAMAAAGATSGTVKVHPNLFHQVLEDAPASAWQVVQDPTGVVVNLVDLRNRTIEAPRIERAVRAALVGEGVENPSVRVRLVSALQRGTTGKAPLVVACARDAHQTSMPAPAAVGVR